MSTWTKIWTSELLRHAIANLDAKTGLSAAKLDVRLNSRSGTLGFYRKGVGFQFSAHFFNDPKFAEADAIDTIRHEYAHYYAHVLDLKKWVPTPKNQSHHGPDWKYACSMVGAAPIRLYDMQALRPVTTRTEAEALFRADDVRPLDIRAHLRKWDCLPMNAEACLRLDRRLQQTLPEHKYFRVQDEVLHPKWGFALVLDTYPGYEGIQYLWLRFEDGKEARLTNGDVVKVAK